MNGVLIWKTCRVLANQSRLRILKRLMERTELCVTEVAEFEGLTPVVASEHLRLLHESGFLKQTRESKWTFYSVVSVPELAVSKKIFKPLKKQLSGNEKQIQKIFKSATAFTHPRRIEVIKNLNGSPRAFEELRDQCDFSFSAMNRHLEKLCSRGLVQKKSEEYELLPGGTELEKVLINICCQS